MSILDKSEIDKKLIKKDDKIKGLQRYILSSRKMVRKDSYLDYRVTNRGGKGIIGIINSPRNGNISSTLVVNDRTKLSFLQIKVV